MKSIEVSETNFDNYKDFFKDESNISSLFKGQIILPEKEEDLIDFLKTESSNLVFSLVERERA